MPPIEARKSSPSTFSGRPPGPGPEVGPMLRILGQALVSKSGLRSAPRGGFRGVSSPRGLQDSTRGLAPGVLSRAVAGWCDCRLWCHAAAVPPATHPPRRL